MKCHILLLVLLLAGCAKSNYQTTACWFPEQRTATTNDVKRFTSIVSALKPGKVELREITGDEPPPATNAPSHTKLALPVPPKPVFKEYAISESAKNAIIASLMSAGPVFPKDSGSRGREIYLYLAAERPYGEVLVLELLANDGVLAHLQHRQDFPKNVEIVFSIPGLGNIITEQMNSK